MEADGGLGTRERGQSKSGKEKRESAKQTKKRVSTKFNAKAGNEKKIWETAKTS